LFYIGMVMLQMVHFTFAQSGGSPQGFQQPGTDGQGGQEVVHSLGDRNPNHWSNNKFIYRCAAQSTLTSCVPNFDKTSTSDDVMDLYVKQCKCSKVDQDLQQLPAKCDWYPTICPSQTIYIRGFRKQVQDSTPHFEYECCVNENACLSQCQDKSATLTTNQRVFFYPEQQMQSDTPAAAISTIMCEDTSGVATIQWKFCESTTLCYTPSPNGPNPNSPPGSALGLLGLLGLLALLALASSSSSSSSSAPATTAAG